MLFCFPSPLALRQISAQLCEIQGRTFDPQRKRLLRIYAADLQATQAKNKPTRGPRGWNGVWREGVSWWVVVDSLLVPLVWPCDEASLRQPHTTCRTKVP